MKRKQFCGFMIAMVTTTMFNIYGHVTQPAGGGFQEREEINQSYELSPGAEIELSGVTGPAEIRTTEGRTAQVHIIRTARSRAELEDQKFIIEQTPTRLVVRKSEERDQRSSRDVQVNERVVLQLPRQINLTVSSISGHVTIGDVGGSVRACSISGSLTLGKVSGEVRVSSISGSVRVGLVVGHLGASSVSGNLSAAIVRLDERGIQLSSISGPVELRFEDELNADLSVTTISGKVYFDVPRVELQSAFGNSNVRARIGSGGSPISISSLSGNLLLARSK